MAVKDIGHYKNIINKALYADDNLRVALLGKNYKTELTTESAVIKSLHEHIKSHLFIDEPILKTFSYVMYDVVIPTSYDKIQTMQLVVYVFCDKDCIDNLNVKNYEGNRNDIICEIVDGILTRNDLRRTYGIGNLELSKLDLFERQQTVAGKILTYAVPNFA